MKSVPVHQNYRLFQRLQILFKYIFPLKVKILSHSLIFSFPGVLEPEEPDLRWQEDVQALPRREDVQDLRRPGEVRLPKEGGLELCR